MSAQLPVEPHQVACRGLAKWVAEQEEPTLEDRVGYHVRDDRRKNADTGVLFATTGVVYNRYVFFEV
ncbi:MAG: hypothetical protein GY847_36960 [Proteobacteria bacterium]|nr:hypothetical protein [Pseudomonadota bacterium]